MNKYKTMLATARTYLMLSKATGSKVYRQQAKNTLNELKKLLKRDVTVTMEIKL